MATRDPFTTSTMSRDTAMTRRLEGKVHVAGLAFKIFRDNTMLSYQARATNT